MVDVQNAGISGAAVTVDGVVVVVVVAAALLKLLGLCALRQILNGIPATAVLMKVLYFFSRISRQMQLLS